MGDGQMELGREEVFLNNKVWGGIKHVNKGSVNLGRP